MANEIQYDVGVDDLLIVMMKENDTISSAPVYDSKIWRIPNIVKVGVKGNGSSKTKYASNKIFARVGRETEQELSLTHVGFPVELWDLMNGVTSTEGVSFGTSEVKEMPFFAVGLIGPTNSGDTVRWYPRVQLSNAEEFEKETNEEEVEIKDLSCTMTASPLLNNAVIKADFNSARTTVKDLTIDKFIAQVVYDESQLADIVKPVTRGDK